jgi:predicted SAM-dependent methyltransferase
MNVRRLGTSALPALSVGLAAAARLLMTEIKIRERHWRGAIKARRYRGQRGLALHLGCGSRIKAGWVNVDIRRSADLMLDLRERLPFDADVFRVIYSEHFLEHFDYPRRIKSLLTECLRVMQPGGLFTFGVPDGEMVLRHYVERDNAEHAAAQLKSNPSWCRTQMDHLNYCMRQRGEHRWYYDEETMRLLLEDVGFVAIERRGFDAELDQEKLRVGTMYMQCRKALVISERSMSGPHSSTASSHAMFPALL